MKLPKILMFTPTYAGKDYCFDKFVENVGKFTYPNIKHIIIDNSPDDNYYKTLKERLVKSSIEVYHVDRGGSSREAIARAQNFARKMALEGEYDYMFSLESDIFPDYNIIERLLIHCKKVVTGLYLIGTEDKKLKVPCITVFDYKPEIGMFGSRLIGVKEDPNTKKKFLDEKEIMDFLEPGLKEVAAGGMGVCLFHKDVFTKIPFMYEPKMNGHSDIFWFNECFRNQFRVFVDTGAYCEHEYSAWSKVTDR
jgi:GT2 family glycosyltransferase